ncbi:hypothetical protein [Microbulbifer elongatus]|uniref:hypothetical protein n=1 Tax=Microbulbifer elongatus TaxID=86173 RepID=UPI001CFE938D|nr:hypothetical protein [Microbulbifer elongatus]
MSQRDFKKNEDLNSKTRDAISLIELKIEEILLTPSVSERDYGFAAYHLFSILSALFRFMDKENVLKGAAIDDFAIETVSNNEKKVMFQGRCYWLGGRRGADNFQINYAKNTRPNLYSFRFRSIDGRDPQDLYVGKTFSGWEVGNA